MNKEQPLEVVEKILLKRELTSLEQLILLQSWEGQGYDEMAEGSGYCSNYFKVIGSQLWHQLSEVVGKKVTKKNLQLILKNYQAQTNVTFGITTLQQPSDYNAIEDKIAWEDGETEIKYPGSPLSFNSSFYINRPPVEKLGCAEIHQPGCILRIKAAKRMGKSSLLNQLIAHAKTFSYRTVYIDFQEAEDAIFVGFDKFLRWFTSNVSRQLHLKAKLDDYWDEDIGSKVSCKIYFEEYLLEQIDTPVVLVFNEIDRLFEYPSIFKDFLPMLRFWHELAQQLEIWQKLRLVVTHSTESYIPLKFNQSPFNVGLTITLPYFNLGQVVELAQRYQLSWQGANDAHELMQMVGGHPYLINIALYHLSRKDVVLPELLLTAPTQSGVYNQHLRNLLAMVRWDNQLASALQQVMTVNGNVQLEAIVAHKLESLGVIKLEGNLAMPSCELYRLYFLKQLTGVGIRE